MLIEGESHKMGEEEELFKNNSKSNENRAKQAKLSSGWVVTIGSSESLPSTNILDQKTGSDQWRGRKLGLVCESQPKFSKTNTDKKTTTQSQLL